MLSVFGLAAWRGDRCLFQDLSFCLGERDLLHVRGANGSGKTTLLRILCGLRLPDDGEVRWQGHDIAKTSHALRANLAFLGHHDGVKLDLTAAENLRALVDIRGGLTELTPDVALARAGLAEVIDLPGRLLSAGQRRRVALAALRARRVKLWILDEPFNTLDSAGAEQMAELIELHRSRGGATILTSHQALPCSLRDVSTLELGA